jgi:hypothetical protein
VALAMSDPAGSSLAALPKSRPRGSARPDDSPVSVGIAVGAGDGHADALSFALGVSLHVGIAVTEAEAFLYAAVSPGNVAAVGPD